MISAASANGAARGVCECDKALVQTLYDSKADNSNYSASNCVASGGGASLDCCNYNTHFYASFNTFTQCCDKAAGIKEIGTC